MNASWLERNRHIVFVITLIIALGGAAGFYLRRPAQNPIEILSTEAAVTAAPTLTPRPEPTATPAPVRVYITGGVANSDVYFLPRGSIIKDAVKAAGGFTPDADPERINQAQELQDQQQIHIPRKGEKNPPPPVQDGQSAPNEEGGGSGVTGGVINLNTATLEELDTLPGIGPAIAQRIIDYRTSIGGFTSVDEITQVSGIGDSTFAKIKDLIRVE